MKYTIKITGFSENYVEQEPNRHGWDKVVNFTVKELGYSDSVSLPENGFKKKEAKKLIKDKIKNYLVKLKEQEEYTEKI